MTQTELTPKAEPRDKQGEGWIDTAAHWIGWIMLPLLMPVYAMIFAFTLSVLSFTNTSVKVTLTLIVAGINTALPMLLILLLKFFGFVKDPGLNSRTERFIPYAVSIAALGVTAWFLSSRGAPLWLVTFFLGGAAAGVVNLIINFWWKISAHAAGAAGVLALLVRIAHEGLPIAGSFTWLAVWALLTGLLGSARIYQDRHTLGQVLAGYAVGFTGVYLMMMIH